MEGRVLIGAGGGFCWGGEDFDRGWWRFLLGMGRILEGSVQNVGSVIFKKLLNRSGPRIDYRGFF